MNPLVAMVRNRHLPGLRPSFIADPIVQSEHGIDVGSIPMHPSPLQTSFDHEFVGTFHHARTNRPPILSEGGILHERLSLLQVTQMLANAFQFSQMNRQALAQAKEETGASMFESM